jgi:hypothetical protein
LDKLVSRNISIGIILIAILTVVVIVRGRTSFSKDETSFAAIPQKEITRIEFSGRNGTLTLEKKDTWFVNGKNEARRSGIAFIERILTEIKIKSPVSPDLFEKEITSGKIDPVKVRVYENNKLLRSFLVYKTGSNIYGNIMKMRERSKPFIVYLPGFEGDIGSGFNMNELFWLPYTIFNLLPSEISTVNFENLRDLSSSFNIRCSNDVFTLSDGNNNLSGWDTTRVRRYLSYFTLIPFEKWALELSQPESDSIQSTPPLCRIGVKKTDGTAITLTLWEKIIPETGSKDSDRLWGKTGSGSNLFVMRYFDIDPLLKKKSYFFTE